MCGRCGKICPQDALHPAGYHANVQEVMDILLRDRIYYQASGGGITISGGEPLFQPTFCLQLLEAAKSAGIHTAIETSGYAKKEILQATLPYTDLFLFDYKISDPLLHKKWTGTDNQIILENLRMLVSENKSVLLRCPLIPGINDDIKHLRAITRLCKALSLKAKIMPYHNMGIRKEQQLGRVPFQSSAIPSDAQIQHWKQQIGFDYIVDTQFD